MAVPHSTITEAVLWHPTRVLELTNCWWDSDVQKSALESHISRYQSKIRSWSYCVLPDSKASPNKSAIASALVAVSSPVLLSVFSIPSSSLPSTTTVGVPPALIVLVRFSPGWPVWSDILNDVKTGTRKHVVAWTLGWNGQRRGISRRALPHVPTDYKWKREKEEEEKIKIGNKRKSL